MKKLFIGILLGVVLGVAGARFLSRAPAGQDAAKTETPAKPAEKPKENPLHLPPEKRTAAGIVLAKPIEATLTPEVQAYGRVLDPTPFVTIVAEQETARVALAAAEKELQRVQKLFAAGGNASAQAVETAEAAVGRERAALASARVRLLAGWGRELAGVADMRYVTEALEKGRSLVRLDVLPGEFPADKLKSARVGLVGASEQFDADVLGAAPAADPQIQGVSLLAMLRDHTLPSGVAVRATLAGVGETQKVLTVPRSAIVYHQGSAWIYVLGEEDTFERKLVAPGRSVGSNITLISGAEADEQIVTTGAQQLLAAELQAGGAPEES
jgi:hypothetical protein